MLWPLQNCTVQFPFSDTLALCVTLGKFLSLSGPTLLFLEDGWTPTSQLLVKIVWTVAPCVLSSRLVINVSFPSSMSLESKGHLIQDKDYRFTSNGQPLIVCKLGSYKIKKGLEN